MAIVLVVCVGLLSLLSVVAGYVRGELLDTDSYVEIVAPLARNPAVQAEVVDAVTNKVVDSVNFDDLAASARELLAARDGRLAQLLNSDRRLADALNSALSGLGPLLQNQVAEATRRATERVVESPRFAELWTEANRVAQRATLAALRDEGSALRTDDGAVRIDVGVIVEEVKQRLVQSGFALAERIPTVDSEIVLIESAQLAQAQRALLIFDQIAPWVPWVTLGAGGSSRAGRPGTTSGTAVGRGRGRGSDDRLGADAGRCAAPAAHAGRDDERRAGRRGRHRRRRPRPVVVAPVDRADRRRADHRGRGFGRAGRAVAARSDQSRGEKRSISGALKALPTPP